MLNRLSSLILAILILLSMAGEAAARSSVLESVTYKTEENRSAITFLYNQPTKMVFYTIGNPPQIVADIVGNAFAQAANVPTEIIVNGVEVKSIIPFVDPSLGDAYFYGIDFLVIHLKEKVAYTQVKHKKGYTLYIANSPSQEIADIRPQFKKEVKKEKIKTAPSTSPITPDRTQIAAAEKVKAEPMPEVNIESQAIAAAINAEPGATEDKPETALEFKPKKIDLKSKKVYDDSDDSVILDTNISFGKGDSDFKDERPIKREKKSKAKVKKKTAGETAERTIKSDIPSDKEVRSAGVELEPKNVAAITPAAHTEKLRLAMQWRQIGYSHQKNKEYDKALKSYNKAVELHPNYACIHNDLGIIYFHLGVYDKAIVEFQKAIKLDNEYLASYSNLATVYEQIGDNKKAIEYWRKRVAASKSNDVWTQKAKQKIEELERKGDK